MSDEAIAASLASQQIKDFLASHAIRECRRLLTLPDIWKRATAEEIGELEARCFQAEVAVHNYRRERRGPLIRSVRVAGAGAGTNPAAMVLAALAAAITASHVSQQHVRPGAPPVLDRALEALREAVERIVSRPPPLRVPDYVTQVLGLTITGTILMAQLSEQIRRTAEWVESEILRRGPDAGCERAIAEFREATTKVLEVLKGKQGDIPGIRAAEAWQKALRAVLTCLGLTF